MFGHWSFASVGLRNGRIARNKEPIGRPQVRFMLARRAVHLCPWKAISNVGFSSRGWRKPKPCIKRPDNAELLKLYALIQASHRWRCFTGDRPAQGFWFQSHRQVRCPICVRAREQPNTSRSWINDTESLIKAWTFLSLEHHSTFFSWMKIESHHVLKVSTVWCWRWIARDGSKAIYSIVRLKHQLSTS